jgi:hypothetical protein
LRLQSCLKVQPERRKEVKRKLNRANNDRLLSLFSDIFGTPLHWSKRCSGEAADGLRVA